MPRSTLEPDRMQAFIVDRLADNGGCELPCWWGVTPGETEWERMIQFFTEQGIRVWAESGSLDLGYASEWGEGRWTFTDIIEVGFHQADGVVQSIDVQNNTYYTALQEDFATVWQPYALQSVLSRYRVPSQVLLNLTVGAPCVGSGIFPDYGMWVVYEEQGIAIRYAGLLLSEHDRWLLCPIFGHIRDIQIRLQPPGVDTELVDLSSETYDSSGYFSIYGSLPELTGMDAQGFYDAFSQPQPQTCVEIPNPHPAYNEIILPFDDQILSPDIEDVLVTDMLAGNGGCELPCWWSITPGETSWEDAQQRFLSLGKSISSWWDEPDWGTRHKVGLFGHHEPYPFDYVIEHILHEQDGRVSLIGVHGHAPGWPADEWSTSQHFARDWEQYSLDQVLARFGQPSLVLLHYWSEGESPFGIGVMYEEQGVLIEYMGLTQGEQVEDRLYFDPVVICPGQDHVTDINLWLRSPGPQPDATLADVFQRFGGGHLGLLPYHSTPTLEEATGMGLDEFYTMFRDPNAGVCLEAQAAMSDVYP